MKKNLNEQARKKAWLDSKELTSLLLPGNESRAKRLHEIKLRDPYDNKFHLSAYSGLINDPNGLHHLGKKYHIFYQWSPFAPVHINKHWGHFETEDFISYKHTGMAISPVLNEEINGAYSGAALVYDRQGYLFYTGNVKPNKGGDASRTAFTIVGQWDEKSNVLKNKQPLFEVDKSQYTGHFRDPKPFMEDNIFYIIHGVQTKSLIGTLALYQSHEVDKNYTYKGELRIYPEISDPGYMWECPDYFRMGTDEFLVFSMQGKSFFESNNQNRDTVVVIRGKMDLRNNTFSRIGDLHILDHGFDFYAPQTFANSPDVIMLAWAGMNEDSLATFDHMWAHNLTIPRVLTFRNNTLYQSPHPSLRKIRYDAQELAQTIYELSYRYYEFEFQPTEMPLLISLYNDQNEQIKIMISPLQIVVDRSQMSFEQSPESGYRRVRSLKDKVDQVTIFVDASLIEIYLNEGQFVFTTKYFVSGGLKISFSKKVTGSFYKLRPLEIDWNV